MKSKKLIIISSIMALLLAISWLGFYIYHSEYRRPLFEIYFFSLNKGRSIFIRTPQNKTLLIGGGQNTEIIRELTKVMPFYKRKIDTVIIPSAVPAQIGGLLEIINRYKVDEIIMPKLMATSTVLTQLLKEIHKQKIHIEEVERGDEIDLENNKFKNEKNEMKKDVKLKVLFPYEGFKYNKTSLPELGLEISYGSNTAYLFGNLSKTIQKDILKYLEMKSDEDNNIDNSEIKLKNRGNIVEFYNSAIDSKVSQELLEKIKAKFIWNTKEKTMHFISEGEGWIK